MIEHPGTTGQNTPQNWATKGAAAPVSIRKLLKRELPHTAPEPAPEPGLLYHDPHGETSALCSVSRPPTQQNSVPNSSLCKSSYSWIYVTVSSLPAGAPRTRGYGIFQLRQRRRQATWRVWPVWLMLQTKADPHHHCCAHFAHCPELGSGSSPGLRCFLTVSSIACSGGSVCSSVIWGWDDLPQIHLQGVVKVKVRE